MDAARQNPPSASAPRPDESETPSRLDTFWIIYDVADTDEEARQMFTARYGYEPQEVWRDGGCVHAGPITKAEHNGKIQIQESEMDTPN